MLDEAATITAKTSHPLMTPVAVAALRSTDELPDDSTEGLTGDLAEDLNDDLNDDPDPADCAAEALSDVPDDIADRSADASPIPGKNCRNIMNGMDLLASLPDGSVASSFFDPQYRGVLDKLGYGNEGARQKQRADLSQMGEEMIRYFISELDRVLRPSGHLFLWIDKFHLCEGTSSWFEGTSLELVDLITWNKGRIGMGYRSRRKCEYLQVFQKKPKRVKGVWTLHNIPDVWDEKVDAKQHTHSKPVGLQKALIEATTSPGDVVVDPASGSYSVLEACRQAGGRTFYGADLVTLGQW